MTSTPEPFGFIVRRNRDEPDKWHVQLPHQCDAWDIAATDWDGIEHAAAIAELERFIAEAQTALTALRNHEEQNSDLY